ncbi:MAG TPA: hypothetical protein VMM93_08715 [Vicinamibacterales bacterium]|nr:hypothetical protein [Vicinamibacterales bacterium]
MVLALGVLSSDVPTRAQSSQARTHMGHVMDGFSGTPGGQGLLPVAMKEAGIAAQHAELAAKTPDNLDAMKLHAGHVLHAIDPSLVERGPGLGYGLKKAAAGVSAHIGLAAKADDASDNVKLHATHVATSADNVVKRCDEIVAAVEQIRAASTAADAARLVARLQTLVGQLIPGVDADGDGRIGWQAGEGGLQHAQQHMELMLK